MNKQTYINYLLEWEETLHNKELAPEQRAYLCSRYEEYLAPHLPKYRAGQVLHANRCVAAYLIEIDIPDGDGGTKKRVAHDYKFTPLWIERGN